MIIVIRVIVSVLVALIFSSFYQLGYNDGLPGLIILFVVNVMAGGLPLLGFVCIVLLPIEAGLSRFSAGPAMLAIAPLLGWGLPRLVLFATLTHAHATEALPMFTTLGVSCGVVWGATAMFPDQFQR